MRFICQCVWFVDQYQFEGKFRSQSSMAGGDELDGPGLDNMGIDGRSETTSTAADLLKRGAGNSNIGIFT